MHTANIMHRDIKPANLLIDQNCSVKVCDFGLSRDVPLHIKDDQSMKVLKSQYKKDLQLNPEQREQTTYSYRAKVSKLLQSKFAKSEFKNRKRCLSNRVYSRWYRPPEVILTEKEYCTQGDMWSLGCILAELLKLSEPYTQTRRDQAVLSQLVKDRILF